MLKFKCFIQDEDKNNETKSADRSVDVEQEETMELGEFEDWVRNRYQIPGELSLYYGRDKLDDPCVELGTVLKSGDTLIVAFDKTVTAAGGGYGHGGWVKGVLAEGSRGRDQESVTGGGGYGGDAKGSQGAGGEGFGGPANTGLGGTAKGGAGIGGTFTLAKGPRGAPGAGIGGSANTGSRGGESGTFTSTGTH
ncbi:hypothetical protein V8E51_010975 [Hyaloscypha variabilis]